MTLPFAYHTGGSIGYHRRTPEPTPWGTDSMTVDKAREVFPIQFFDPGKHPVAPGKDFSIRPHSADIVVPELEPELVAELDAAEGTEQSEEPAEDPKGSSATESASSSVVTETTAVVSVEVPAVVEKVPSPPSTEPLKPTSSPSQTSGSSVPPVVPVPATTRGSGSAKQRQTVTKPS